MQDQQGPVEVELPPGNEVGKSQSPDAVLISPVQPLLTSKLSENTNDCNPLLHEIPETGLGFKIQDPSSVFALASKFNALTSVQPKITGIQRPSSTFAVES